MIIAQRRDSKIRRVGTSLVTTIPADYVQTLHLKPNDRLVIYQISEALLVVPLQYVLEKGSPNLLRLLDDLTELSAP